MCLQCVWQGKIAHLGQLLAKAIKLMPKNLVSFLSKNVVDHLINQYATITVNGIEHLSDLKTPAIFVCNHLSNSDGLVLNQVFKAYDLTFVAGMKLSGNDVTHIGINVVKTTTIEPNSADREGLKKIVELVKRGENLFIFPEGTRSRTGCLIEAKKGILLIAKLTGAPIVPVGLVGTEKLLPINPEGDMSGEKFCKADVKVNIGRPFVIPTNDDGREKKDYEAFVLRFIMLKIAALLPVEYRGVYQ